LPGELGRREAPRTGQSRRLAARLGTCETLGRVGRRAGCGGIVPRPLVFGREAVLAGHRLGRRGVVGTELRSSAETGASALGESLGTTEGVRLLGTEVAAGPVGCPEVFVGPVGSSEVFVGPVGCPEVFVGPLGRPEIPGCRLGPAAEA